MFQQHSVIIVPGLGDRVAPTRWATEKLLILGLDQILHLVAIYCVIPGLYR
jgi:hypothetical protein